MLSLWHCIGFLLGSMLSMAITIIVTEMWDRGYKR